MSDMSTAPSTDLTDTHRETLLGIAEEAIRVALVDQRVWRPDLDAIDPSLAQHGASFVTLERERRLLGCIGALVPYQPLAVDVAEHAVAAAFADPRLPPLTHADYVEMSIKVSVLGPPRPFAVASYEELRARLEPGVDGLIVEAPGHRATFLPSVWRDLRDVDAFLEHLWAKAGLPARAWPEGIEIARYVTDEFADPGPRDVA